MPTLWFVVPVHGRESLTAICLRQLRHTCDALGENGVAATAVVIGDDENLDTARELGFGTIERDNSFTSAKYNDGIQLALDPSLTPKECDLYRVVDRGRFAGYRGHEKGEEFVAQLDPKAERRAIDRGSIEKLGQVLVRPENYTLPDGFAAGGADYVVPCGSDDWVYPALFNPFPPKSTIYAFQRLSFVRPDGREMVQRFINVRGGCGIRIYPAGIFRSLGYRPAAEDKKRGCDTSIITNLTRAERPKVDHRQIDPRWIVDWKSSDVQLNPYESLKFHRTFENPQDPFEALADLYPPEALEAMQNHYAQVRELAAA